MIDRPPAWLTTAPGTDSTLQAAFRQACTEGTGIVFIGVDYGGDDWTTEAVVEVQRDGNISIQNIHSWRVEIDQDK